MSIFNKFKKQEAENDQSQSVSGAKGKSGDDKKVATETTSVAKAKTTDDKSSTKAVKTGQTANLSYGVLVKPLITEKATTLSQNHQYVFEVSVKANKIEIGAAVAKKYGVKPVSVNIINSRGRLVRYGKSSGTTKKTKKAVVTLPAGKSIKVHEGV